ncbi:hypothetical protein [Sagittula sp. S175]|uniref:hypothetical protein n=1 Tax=Sagittula sp. S175 TaxID=3415129 RepID=UPI003C79FE94
MFDTTTATALWGAVVVSGLYHGANPGMGWPLAVSAALMDRKGRSLWRALAALAGGHLLAMAAILFPFGALVFLVRWQEAIQIGAASLVIAMGLYLLVNRRHPRFLARVPPTRLALWSFLAAMAHGAGLMLVPIYLGICDAMDENAAGVLMAGRPGAAVLVALVHTVAMFAAGAGFAFTVYRWFGLKALSRSWFNLDAIWALSLVLIGSVSLVSVIG